MTLFTLITSTIVIDGVILAALATVLVTTTDMGLGIDVYQPQTWPS